MFPGCPKDMFTFFGGFGNLAKFIFEKKNDKFKHCDVFTVHYLEFVSIFGAKTFSGRLECMSEKFNRNPHKFNEGIAI